MLALTRLRDLTLAEPPSPGRPSYISAASGLVDLGDRIAVVADDELHLAVFPTGSADPGQLLRLFDGSLPAEKADRKRLKPDLEVLMCLSQASRDAAATLLALGSGSTPDRCRGVAFSLDDRNLLRLAPSVIDLRLLFEGLAETIPGLNIEGATIQNDEFRLFHRGNNSFPENFVIRLPLSTLQEALETGLMARTRPIDVHHLDLGRIGGVPYSVTDAAALPDGRTLVTAVAEDTADAYADGACIGALVGMMDRDMDVVCTWPLEQPFKVEGIAAKPRGKSIDLMLVADADNPDLAASLYSATIET